MIDEAGRAIGYSRLFKKRPDFLNALVQNIAGGNTMVFNNAARELLAAAGNCMKIVAHDWWTYMLVAGAGGEIHYDPTPLVRHRQHANNLIGTSRPGILSSYRILSTGSFRSWTDLNVQALQRVSSILTPANRQALDEFVKARDEHAIPKIRALLRTGIYRQTRFEDVGLLTAALLNMW